MRMASARRSITQQANCSACPSSDESRLCGGWLGMANILASILGEIPNPAGTVLRAMVHFPSRAQITYARKPFLRKALQ